MIRTATMTVAACLVAFTSTASASDCRGLTQQACQANPQCVHVSAYTRSDGTQVNSYCRKRRQGHGDQTDDARASPPS